jgi:DNA-binding GntR family transcriptional regulator
VNTSTDTATLASEAYSVVRRRILRGELALGQPVSRRKLAAELGMSFLPVSEALLRLECEGLLESRPRAGTRVPIPSPKDVEGQYIVREALEVQAAVLFTDVASSTERSELRRLAARVDSLSTQGDRTMYVEVHQKLHFRIADGARCKALRDALEKSHALAATWFCAMRKVPNGASSTRHQELIDAVISGDRTLAAEAVRQHLESGRKHAMEVLDPYFRLHSTIEKRFSRSETPVLTIG